MIQAVPQVHRVNWESMPISLRPEELTILQKIGRVVCEFFSIAVFGLIRLAAYAIGRLATRAILPAADLDEETKEFSRMQMRRASQMIDRHYETIPYTVVTPDGVSLSATLFRHRGGNAETPTTVYFSGNNALKGCGSGWPWLIDEAIERGTPRNVVAFDYRSTGDSDGTFYCAKDLIVDGSSVVDWVRKVVKTPDDKIDFYGMSLGGAIALKTKAADGNLTGKLVNERSFSSLVDWIAAHPSLKSISGLAALLLRNQDLDLDAAEDYGKLKGRKLFIYHRQDPVIFYGASMAGKVPLGETFELKEKIPGGNHHCQSLDQYHGAKERVADFIFMN